MLYNSYITVIRSTKYKNGKICESKKSILLKNQFINFTFIIFIFIFMDEQLSYLDLMLSSTFLHLFIWFLSLSGCPLTNSLQYLHLHHNDWLFYYVFYHLMLQSVSKQSLYHVPLEIILYVQKSLIIRKQKKYIAYNNVENLINN